MTRILSVEDDADIQRMIGKVLFLEGYEVNYAWNGKEGYEKIISFRPDLILLDLMLPIFNGVELLKKIQQDKDKSIQAIPVIVLSGFGDEANLLGYSVKELGGAADYLRKPVTMKDLIASVKNTLARFPSSRNPKDQSTPEQLRKGAVHADVKFRTVWVNDRLVATLPRKRFALLRCLMESPAAVSREEILKNMGYAARQVDALKQDIHRLRKDFGPVEKRRIQTTADGYELIG